MQKSAHFEGNNGGNFLSLWDAKSIGISEREKEREREKDESTREIWEREKSRKYLNPKNRDEIAALFPFTEFPFKL